MPPVALDKTIVVIASPVHAAWLDGVATAPGVGFTNTVAVAGVPLHPSKTGIMVNVTVIGEEVVLVNEPDISPLPLAAIPVTVPVLSLVQLKMLPGVPDNIISAIAVPEQMVCDDGVAVATAVGLIVMVTGAELSARQTPF